MRIRTMKQAFEAIKSNDPDTDLTYNAFRIPSVIFAFTVFIWVTGFPLWLGIVCSVVASVGFWLLLPNYVENISKAGEATRKALFHRKQNDEDEKTGSDS